MTGIRRRLGSILGPEGRVPQFVEGTTTQLRPSEPAKVELTKTGEAEYRVDVQVPRGLDGDPTAVANFGEALATELITGGSVAHPALDIQTAHTLQNPNTQSYVALRNQQIATRKTASRGAVVIMWDDGRRSIWNHLRPLLLARPWQRHSFAIYVDGTEGGTMLDAHEVRQLSDEGHEICSHAVTENPHIRDLPPAERAYEYDYSKEYLEQLTGKPITTFVYPNGTNSRSDLTDSEMYLRYGRVMSNIGSRPLSFPGQTSHFVHRMLWNQGTHNTVMERIRGVAGSGMTLCIAGHDVGVPGDLSVAQVEEALDLIDDLGIETLTPSEAYPDSQAPLVNAGFEHGLDGWGAITSGTGAVSTATGETLPGMPGENVLRLTAPGGGSSDWAYVAQTVPVIPGETYVFSALVKVVERAGPSPLTPLRIRPYHMSPGLSPEGRTESSDILGIVGEWAQFSMEWVATDPYGRLDLRLAPSHGGEVLFDQVFFGPKHLGVYNMIPLPTPPEPEDLLINPGFESGLEGWGPVTSGTGIADTMTGDTMPGASGVRVLRLTSEGDSASDWVYVTQRVPVVQGETYTFSALIKVVERTGTYPTRPLRITAGGTAVQSDILETMGEWVEFSMQWVADDTSARLDLRLSTNHGGEILFDDVRLELNS